MSAQETTQKLTKAAEAEQDPFARAELMQRAATHLAVAEDHGAEVGVDWVRGEVIHDGPGCPGWHAWDAAIYGQPGL